MTLNFNTIHLLVRATNRFLSAAHRDVSSPLDLLFVSFSPEFLNILLAVALLCLALLLEDLDGFIKRLDGGPLHLDFLEKKARD